MQINILKILYGLLFASVSRLHCESESFKMDLILDVNIQIYPVDLGKEFSFVYVLWSRNYIMVVLFSSHILNLVCIQCAHRKSNHLNLNLIRVHVPPLNTKKSFYLLARRSCNCLVTFISTLSVELLLNIPLCTSKFSFFDKNKITKINHDTKLSKRTIYIFPFVHFIKVTSSDWLLPARYMKTGPQMTASTILRMTDHLGKTFALHVVRHVS